MPGVAPVVANLSPYIFQCQEVPQWSLPYILQCQGTSPMVAAYYSSMPGTAPVDIFNTRNNTSGHWTLYSSMSGAEAVATVPVFFNARNGTSGYFSIPGTTPVVTGPYILQCQEVVGALYSSMPGTVPMEADLYTSMPGTTPVVGRCSTVYSSMPGLHQ
jgi:hypothetical protein